MYDKDDVINRIQSLYQCVNALQEDNQKIIAILSEYGVRPTVEPKDAEKNRERTALEMVVALIDGLENEDEDMIMPMITEKIRDRILYEEFQAFVRWKMG